MTDKKPKKKTSKQEIVKALDFLRALMDKSRKKPSKK